MKRLGAILIAFAILAALPAHASITTFKHIVVIVQENRTPDNLFNAMCQQQGGSAPCTNSSTDFQYDIQTGGWKNYQTTIAPTPVALNVTWDIEHHYNPDWMSMCDVITAQQGNVCLMDGAASEHCGTLGSCPQDYLPEFTYVKRYDSTGFDVLGPYITLALTYGWANKMFATNQGPSFPAHQFIYGGTSAPVVNDTENDDMSGIYAAENLVGSPNGCLADQGAKIQLIQQGLELQPDDPRNPYPCFQHQTLGTLLLSQNPLVKWRYYTPGVGNLWTAPTAIQSECGATNVNGGVTVCPGLEFQTMSPSPYVVPDPKKILTDIGSCHLPSVSWVIPKGQYSDHAHLTNIYGPQWVASIVNSIGTSQCTDNGLPYWQDTAIVITWDDWGGWYDHEAPQLNTIQGYQLGFRVPMLFVSAYGKNNDTSGNCNPYIDGDNVLDFGSIANFIEGNFLGGWVSSNEGQLHFADARALLRSGTQDLSNFFDLTKQACTFHQIQTQVNAQYFIDDNSAALPPDDE